MSDIGIFSSPGDTSFLLLLLVLTIQVAAMLLCILIAVVKTAGNKRSAIDDRFFGYAVGGAASALTAGVLLAVVTATRDSAFAGWADDWAALWIILLVALWLMVAYQWNRRRQRAAQEQ